MFKTCEQAVDILFNAPLTMSAQDSHDVQGVGALMYLRESGVAMVSCLVIDRNEGERHMLGGLMTDMGFACTEVDAMEDGVRFCQHNQPDVVVMDASALPEARDFLRLTAKAGRRNGRPIVILYADKPDFDTMGETMMEGAAEFLMKPFDRDLLKFKLRQSGVLPN